MDLDLDADGDPFDQVNRHTPIPAQNHATYKLRQQNAFLSQSPLEYGGTRLYPYQPGFVILDKEEIYVDKVAWELESPGRYSLRIMDRNEKPVNKR